MALLDSIPRKPRSPAAIAFYSQCRYWHGYLSAFAFLALIFFSASGILLNHPEWLSDEEASATPVSGSIPVAELTSARRTADPGAALGLLAASHLSLLGAYTTADIDTRQALLRYEGVKGSSVVTVNLKTGAANAKITRADVLTVIDDLHRGKNVGKTWRAVIDISGAVVLLLSLLGYILFFMFRFRLRVGLILTAFSLAAMAAIFAFFVP